MIDFVTALRLFYALLGVSVMAAGVLLISYQLQRQNLLLRSCCVILLIMYATIFAGHVTPERVLDEKYTLCEVQAVFLGYCYISIHAHACFMMLSNCYVAMGWKLKLFEQYVDRESTLVLVSYSFPLLFGALYALIRMNTTDYIRIGRSPFFCAILSPRFSLSVAWFMLFAIPGSILATYLLVKTWRARQRTLAFGSSTQLTLPYLFRLTLSTVVYLLLAYGSFLPILIYMLICGMAGEFSPHPIDTADSTMNIANGALKFTKFIPAVLAYFPSVLGFSFFLMYGFGSHARASYRRFANKLASWFGKRNRDAEHSRRHSTLPLMMESTNERSNLAFPHLTSTSTMPSPIELPDEEELTSYNDNNNRTIEEEGGIAESGPPRRSM